jgi:hypothetical protein
MKLKRIIVWTLAGVAMSAACAVAQTVTNAVQPSTFDPAVIGQVIQGAAAVGAPFAGPYAPLVTAFASLLSTLLPAVVGAFIHNHGSKTGKTQ